MTDGSLELTGNDIRVFGDTGVFEARTTRRKVVKVARSVDFARFARVAKTRDDLKDRHSLCPPRNFFHPFLYDGRYWPDIPSTYDAYVAHTIAPAVATLAHHRSGSGTTHPGVLRIRLHDSKCSITRIFRLTGGSRCLVVPSG